MTEFPELNDYVATLPCIVTRKRLLVFSDLVYKPTGEKLDEGYRYFACDVAQVVDAVVRGDVDALAALPFALDEDGEADTSGLLVELSYTASGSFLAMQPVEYQDSNPVPVAMPKVLEGVGNLAPLIKRLDQSA